MNIMKIVNLSVDEWNKCLGALEDKCCGKLIFKNGM